MATLSSMHRCLRSVQGWAGQPSIPSLKSLLKQSSRAYSRNLAASPVPSTSTVSSSLAASALSPHLSYCSKSPMSSTASSQSASPYIIPNLLRSALLKGSSAVGTMIADMKELSVIQIMKNAGMDFIIIDNEHGMFSNESVSALCRYAVALNLTPIVRVADLTYSLIAQSLDGGAQGLVFPRIYTAEQVKTVVSWSRYPPLGVRGSAMWRNYSRWQGGPVQQAMNTHNKETLLLFQIETKEAMDNLDEILAVKGCDGVLVGPNDLSINLGVPDDWDGPVMQTALQRIVDGCRKHAVISGIHISDSPQSVQYHKMGYQLLSANSETGFIAGAATQHVHFVKSALGKLAIQADKNQATSTKAGY